MVRAVTTAGVGRVLIGLLVSGCCPRPSSAWDQTIVAIRKTLPGIVVIVDRARHAAICTGTVLKNEPAGGGFTASVLTAKHCVPDKDHPHRWGVSTPVSGDSIGLVGVDVLNAKLTYASAGDDSSVGFSATASFSSGGVEWIENDWAILLVETPHPLPVISAFGGDPAHSIKPGEPVSLAAYHDESFADQYGPMLRPHEHPFAWTGVPPSLAQGGHSGAPILWNGEVVGVFSGSATNSHACKLVSGHTWTTKLRLVNIVTVLEQAEKQGFFLGPADKRLE